MSEALDIVAADPDCVRLNVSPEQIVVVLDALGKEGFVVAQWHPADDIRADERARIREAAITSDDLDGNGHLYLMHDHGQSMKRVGDVYLVPVSIIDGSDTP